jgi:hypothetical protein
MVLAAQRPLNEKCKSGSAIFAGSIVQDSDGNLVASVDNDRLRHRLVFLRDEVRTFNSSSLASSTG